MRQFSITYHDRFGSDQSTIFSDGSDMYLTLRGIDFEGYCFELLEGQVLDKSKFDCKLYQDGSGDLSNFVMEVVMPIQIEYKQKTSIEDIYFKVQTGKELDIKGLPSYTMQLKTSFGTFSSDKKIGWFDDSIIELQRLLPKDARIKTCLSCKHANYPKLGYGMYGGLHCFKKIKEEVSKIKDDDELMGLWTVEKEKEGKIFNVQETFDCEEHDFTDHPAWACDD